MKQQEIADILTISFVNVTKILARLRRENIIESHRSWIEILDMEKLMEYCSQETLPLSASSV